MVERRTMKIMLHTDIYGGQGLSTICIGRGLLRHIGQFAARTVKGRKAVVVSDSNVGNLHLEPVLASLRESGFSAESVCVPAGEDSKSLHCHPTGFQKTKKKIGCCNCFPMQECMVV